MSILSSPPCFRASIPLRIHLETANFFIFDIKVIDNVATLTSVKRLKNSAALTRRFKGQWVPNRLFYKEEMKND